MGRSNISYLDWNITCVEGCTPISAGCTNCYAQDYLKRFKKPMGITLHPERLERDMAKLARIKEPQIVGIAFTGDLFHRLVPDRFLEKVFNAIKAAEQHTFLLLTKRVDNMAAWFDEFWNFNHGITPNIWPGASVEDQATADDRIPKLLSIPAAHHWVSIEPMLGQVDLWPYLGQRISTGAPDFLGDGPDDVVTRCCEPSLDWVVVGCESGPKRRPCALGWAYQIVANCTSAKVPLFIKQLPEDGKVVKMPRVDGRVWSQTPWGEKSKGVTR